MKKKAFKKVFGTWVLPSCTEGNESAIKDAWKSASRIHNHLAVCSCAGCGNPRRFYKNKESLTLQERRFMDRAASYDY